MESNDAIRFIGKGQTITVTNDSVIMSEALYLRYRRAISAAIERESK